MLLCDSLPAPRNSGSRPAPKHNAGSGGVFIRQHGIAVMVLLVVHCGFQIRFVNQMLVTLPGQLPASCVVANLRCRILLADVQTLIPAVYP